jgi:(2Fe-2S) ferredoxin
MEEITVSSTRQVLVCQYVNCRQNGSEAVLHAFQANPVQAVEIIHGECQGQCNMGPTVRILPDEIWYCRVRPEDVDEIVDQHLRRGNPVNRLLHPRLHPQSL